MLLHDGIANASLLPTNSTSFFIVKRPILIVVVSKSLKSFSSTINSIDCIVNVKCARNVGKKLEKYRIPT